MFTVEELNVLDFCSKDESFTDDKDRELFVSLLAKCNKINFNTLTIKQFLIEHLYNKHEAEKIALVLSEMPITTNDIKPSIIVKIKDGSFSYAFGNMDMELIIEDEDNIERGGDLYYPCLAGYSEESFNGYVKKIRERIALREFEEIKIIVSDPNAAKPIQVYKGGNFEGDFDTVQTALEYLKEVV